MNISDEASLIRQLEEARDSAIIAIDAIRISVRDDSEIAEEIYDAIAAGDIPGIKIE